MWFVEKEAQKYLILFFVNSNYTEKRKKLMKWEKKINDLPS